MNWLEIITSIGLWIFVDHIVIPRIKVWHHRREERFRSLIDLRTGDPPQAMPPPGWVGAGASVLPNWEALHRYTYPHRATGGVVDPQKAVRYVSEKYPGPACNSWFDRHGNLHVRRPQVGDTVRVNAYFRWGYESRQMYGATGVVTKVSGGTVWVRMDGYPETHEKLVIAPFKLDVVKRGSEDES